MRSTTAGDRWRKALAEWQIPPDILAGAEESPWVLPRQVFVRRAEGLARAPYGQSYARAREALDTPGSLLDVGAAAGAASLPLAPRATSICAIDTDEPMLEDFARAAGTAGVSYSRVSGRWPDVAHQVGAADLVVCHHVLYNVPDIEPFIIELDRHARRRVVVEITERHPLVRLNPLWQRIHGIDRPDGPSATDLLAVLDELGFAVHAERWQRPVDAEYREFGELVETTRRRLCLPAARTDEVIAALHELGVSEETAPHFGSSSQDLVTIWWSATRASGDGASDRTHNRLG
ncbi:MAG: class I SAM-dependent methyltransferase [Actinomycetes bacterium]